MKNLFFALTLFLQITTTLAQSKVVESLGMDSELLGTSIKYSVYLPEG